MDSILKNPTVKSFLKGFARTDYNETIKQLVLIGIETVLAKFKGASTKQLKNTIIELIQPKKEPIDGVIAKEIEQIREQLHKINQKFDYVAGANDSQCSQLDMAHCKPPKVVTIAPELSQSKVFNLAHSHIQGQDKPNKGISKETKKQAVAPKVTEVYPDQYESIQTRKVDRRHLDDTQTREALTFPTTPQQSPKSQNKQLKNTFAIQTNLNVPVQLQSIPYSSAYHTIASAIQRSPTYQTVPSSANLHLNQSPSQSKFISIKSQQNKSPSSNNPYKKKVFRAEKISQSLQTHESVKQIAIQPKYLQKVQSKIKDMVKHDKMKSKQSQLKDYSQEFRSHKKQNKNVNIQHKNREDEEDSFSPYKNQSNLEIANKFLKSEIAQQFFDEQVESQSSDLESKDSDFSVFSPAFGSTSRQLEINESAASSSRGREVGKISRRNHYE